ncbi:MAG: ABC transporter substrate-binding protein [Methylocystaceae bacterium]
MKKTIVFLLLLSFIFSVVGCSKTKEATQQKKSSSKTITIGVMPDVESVPFVIADKEGYFKKEGVNVKIVHFKSAKDRDSALQSGQLDGVITDVLAVVFANEGGIGLKMISRNDGDIKLMAGKSSGIADIKSLQGKSIGISTNTIMEYTLDTMLEAGGLKPEQVKKVAIPPLPTRFEMLQGGKIDAAILPDPLAGLAVTKGATVLIDTDKMASKAGAIAFTTKSLQVNKKEIKAVFRAYNDAVKYLQGKPKAEDIDYIIQAQGFPAEVKASMQLPAYKEAALPDPNIVNNVIQWMQAKSLIKGSYEYKNLVDDEILR